MATVAVLNRKLYEALIDAFGSVVMANRGLAFSGRVARDPVTLRKTVQRESSGEYYCVNCPWCGDTRHRLWVNHMFDTTYSGVHMRHLAVCYNEHCEKQEGFFDWLREQLAEYTRTVQRPIAAQNPDAAPYTPALPHLFKKLDELPADHKAVAFMRDTRGFDTSYLSSTWGVGYCDPNSQTREGAGRLILPIYRRPTADEDGQQLYGWQARYFNTLLFTDTPRDKRTPKYLAPVGMQKSQVLFNSWRSMTSPVVVVMEGPYDAMRLGPRCSVSLMGKDMSDAQKRTLWNEWGIKERPVIVMLDSDAPEAADKIYWEIRRYTTRVHVVRTPSSFVSPGKMPRDDLVGCIIDQAGGLTDEHRAWLSSP